MTKYRKKPVVIEAANWNGSDEWADTIVQWITKTGREAEHIKNGLSNHIAITTLEGIMQASEGDWIIQGVKGEFYSCKPDIFATTYEPV